MAENTTLIHQTAILEGLEDFCNHLIESDKFSSCDELYEAFVSVSLGHCSKAQFSRAMGRPYWLEKSQRNGRSGFFLAHVKR